LLSYAVKNRLSPISVSSGNIELPVRFNEEEQSLLKHYKFNKEYTNRQVVGLAAAAVKDLVNPKCDGISEQNEVEITVSLKPNNAGEPVPFRKEQQAMIPSMVNALNKEKILLTEASTGSGKGIALIASALSIKEKSVIASPTIKILKQLVGEYKKFNVKPDFSVMLGRQNFISEHLLSLLLPNLKGKAYKQAVLWLESQATHKDELLEVSWLAENMINACPDLPDGFIDNITLDNTRHLEKHKKGREALKFDRGLCFWKNSIKAANSQSKIIFCTHAMLAIDVLCRMNVGGLRDEDYELIDDVLIDEYGDIEDLLDDNAKSEMKKARNKARKLAIDEKYTENMKYSYGLMGKRALLIDEAHMLESNLASFFTSNISLFNVVQLAKKIDPKQAENLSRPFKKLTKLGASVKQDYTELKDKTLAVKLLEDFTAELRSFLKDKDETADKLVYQLSMLFISISKIIGQKTLNNKAKVTYLSHSPSLNYPRLASGGKSMQKQFNTLWHAYKGAVAVSATLCIPVLGQKHVTPKEGMRYVSQYMGLETIARLYPHKLVEPEVFETDWIRDNVQLHLPECGSDTLCRPSSKLDDDEIEDAYEKWANDVALSLKKIAEKSEGGVLVLTTSYELIDRIASAIHVHPDEDIQKSVKSRLGGNHSLSSRLILQSRGKSFEQIELEYREREAERPIWIGTGRAWTGLDLRSDDNPKLLTDLVVVNIPLNIADSTSHIYRLKTFSWQSIAPQEAAQALKQGIGRLKRDASDQLRHIWFLDNRAVAGPNKEMKHYKLPMEVLKDYELGEPITFENNSNSQDIQIMEKKY
jgi:CRISPR type IV-associated DEAD/DEAH-box helicase Csf4